MIHSVGWTFSQTFNSLALLVWDWQCLEDIWTKGSVNEWMNQWISHGGDCKTAPATPGLLKTLIRFPKTFVRYLISCVTCYYQTRCSRGCSTYTSVIDWFIKWEHFSFKPSYHHYTQTVRARELNFWENVHPPPCVRCQVSVVSFFLSLFLGKLVGLVGGGSVINWAYPV